MFASLTRPNTLRVVVISAAGATLTVLGTAIFSIHAQNRAEAIGDCNPIVQETRGNVTVVINGTCGGHSRADLARIEKLLTDQYRTLRLERRELLDLLARNIRALEAVDRVKPLKLQKFEVKLEGTIATLKCMDHPVKTIGLCVVQLNDTLYAFTPKASLSSHDLTRLSLRRNEKSVILAHGFATPTKYFVSYAHAEDLLPNQGVFKAHYKIYHTDIFSLNAITNRVKVDRMESTLSGPLVHKILAVDLEYQPDYYPREQSNRRYTLRNALVVAGENYIVCGGPAHGPHRNTTVMTTNASVQGYKSGIIKILNLYSEKNAGGQWQPIVEAADLAGEKEKVYAYVGFMHYDATNGKLVFAAAEAPATPAKAIIEIDLKTGAHTTLLEGKSWIGRIAYRGSSLASSFWYHDSVSVRDTRNSTRWTSTTAGFFDIDWADSNEVFAISIKGLVMRMNPDTGEEKIIADLAGESVEPTKPVFAFPPAHEIRAYGQLIVSYFGDTFYVLRKGERDTFEQIRLHRRVVSTPNYCFFDGEYFHWVSHRRTLVSYDRDSLIFITVE